MPSRATTPSHARSRAPSTPLASRAQTPSGPAVGGRAAREPSDAMNPVAELRAFVRASLVDPVPRDHTETDAAFRRRRVVAVVTLVVGAGVLAWALRIDPGDPTFYVATFALAAVWAGGAFLSGPLHLGRARTRDGDASGRAVVQSLALGALLLGLFM